MLLAVAAALAVADDADDGNADAAAATATAEGFNKSPEVASARPESSLGSLEVVDAVVAQLPEGFSSSSCWSFHPPMLDAISLIYINASSTFALSGKDEIRAGMKSAKTLPCPLKRTAEFCT